MIFFFNKIVFLLILYTSGILFQFNNINFVYCKLLKNQNFEQYNNYEENLESITVESQTIKFVIPSNNNKMKENYDILIQGNILNYNTCCKNHLGDIYCSSDGKFGLLSFDVEKSNYVYKNFNVFKGTCSLIINYYNFY